MYYYPTMVADTTEDLHIFIFGGGATMTTILILRFPLS